jgi:hypothetical protein
MKENKDGRTSESQLTSFLGSATSRFQRLVGSFPGTAIFQLHDVAHSESSCRENECELKKSKPRHYTSRWMKLVARVLKNSKRNLETELKRKFH